MEQFHKAQDWLKTLQSEAQFFRGKGHPTLEVTNRLLDAFDRPDKTFAWRVVVGGTAGKGTVCRLTEDVLVRAGKKVTTFFSPHVQVITERIRINGRLIAQETFGECILRVRETATKINVAPTYYEAIIVAGILAGRDAGSEILICEVGCGGEWDAVNAVQGKRIAAVTFIGDDHREIFGGTLERIAETKSGIFTADSMLNISGEKKFQKILERRGPVHFIKGIPQKLNKKIAREICEYLLNIPSLGLPCEASAKHGGRGMRGGGNKKVHFEMQKVHIPARWEKISFDNEIATLPSVARDDNASVILDGAHSAPRFQYILPKIKKITGKKIGVFAMVHNHNAEAFKIIADEFDEIFWTTVPGDRKCWDPEKLQQTIDKGEVQKDPLQAFKEAQMHEGTIFVLGSFYLAGVIRNLFYDPEKILKEGSEFFHTPSS